MHKLVWMFAALLAPMATPALAGSCKSQGDTEAPIVFPKGEASDVEFARSMVPAMLPPVSGAVPTTLTCVRATLSTALGDYAIGGENDDTYPRVAVSAGGKGSAVVYLASSSSAPGVYALVVHTPGAETAVKRLYQGIPSDRRLAEDIRAALGGNSAIMTFDAARKLVSYGFAPVGGVPPPVQRSSRSDSAGPQILIPSSGDPRLLDMTAGMRHIPSGFACPASIDGLPVRLMSIEPKRDSMTCDYRAGTEPRVDDEPIRYQLSLFKAERGETSRDAFEQFVTAGRAAVRIKRDHVPPLATGPAPAPEFAVFWDTEDDGVQGVWVGRSGRWIMALRAQYPPSTDNDTEAGKVAQALFDQAARQIR